MIFPKEFLSLPQKNWINHVDIAQWTQRNIHRGFRFVVFYSSLGPTELITWQKTKQIAFMNIFCGICSMSDCLYHNSDVLMSTMASQITGLFERDSPVTDEFPVQRASSAENVSISSCMINITFQYSSINFVLAIHQVGVLVRQTKTSFQIWFRRYNAVMVIWCVS